MGGERSLRLDRCRWAGHGLDAGGGTRPRQQSGRRAGAATLPARHAEPTGRPRQPSPTCRGGPEPGYAPRGPKCLCGSARSQVRWCRRMTSPAPVVGGAAECLAGGKDAAHVMAGGRAVVLRARRSAGAGSTSVSVPAPSADGGPRALTTLGGVESLACLSGCKPCVAPEAWQTQHPSPRKRRKTGPGRLGTLSCVHCNVANALAARLRAPSCSDERTTGSTGASRRHATRLIATLTALIGDCAAAAGAVYGPIAEASPEQAGVPGRHLDADDGIGCPCRPLG
ncbi:hypothetical protein SNOUR_43735 [Streptomyces noursei ATCC 11455]|nr:hypothetical protein SNOUR_00215 [Streptomyces noursei ATCC 11455]ANZ21969.1 hypothetical protein SNOUR_43735 [Streptomyces noursei ATCC 11455]